MTDRVLVAYGTKFGATAEIAEVIATTLRTAGLEVDAVPARDAARDVVELAALDAARREGEAPEEGGEAPAESEGGEG